MVIALDKKGSLKGLFTDSVGESAFDSFMGDPLQAFASMVTPAPAPEETTEEPVVADTAKPISGADAKALDNAANLAKKDTLIQLEAGKAIKASINENPASLKDKIDERQAVADAGQNAVRNVEKPRVQENKAAPEAAAVDPGRKLAADLTVGAATGTLVAGAAKIVGDAVHPGAGDAVAAGVQVLSAVGTGTAAAVALFGQGDHSPVKTESRPAFDSGKDKGFGGYQASASAPAAQNIAVAPVSTPVSDRFQKKMSSGFGHADLGWQTEVASQSLKDVGEISGAQLKELKAATATLTRETAQARAGYEQHTGKPLLVSTPGNLANAMEKDDHALGRALAGQTLSSLTA